MMLHHFPIKIGDRWHAVYEIPGLLSLHSIADCPTHSSAAKAAALANIEQAKNAYTAVKPEDRKIPSGFYTDADGG